MGFSLRKYYLIMVIVLGSVGVSAAFAATITLSGDVKVENGYLGIGINDGTNDDIIFFDSGNRYLFWDESETQFDFSTAVVTSGVIQAGNDGADVAYNRIGTLTASHTGVGQIENSADMFIADDLEVNDDLYADGDISIGLDDANDDFLVFAGNTVALKWEETGTQFEFSDAVVTSGVIQTGNSGDDVAYNRMGTGFASHTGAGQIENSADMFISDDLEVNGNFFADETIFVGTNNGGNDDVICMDSGCTEELRWADIGGEFRISDDLLVGGKLTASGGVDPPYVSFSSETHDSIKHLAADVEDHEEVMIFWNTENHQMEVYVISEDAFYTFDGTPVPYKSGGLGYTQSEQFKIHHSESSEQNVQDSQ